MEALQKTTLSYTAGYESRADGMEADAPVSAGGKARHVFHYHNDDPAVAEPETVMEIANRPNIAVTILSDYGAVADIYAADFRPATRSICGPKAWTSPSASALVPGMARRPIF